MPALSDWSDGFHLLVSRLLPYKNVDVAIDAFRELPERLVVVGHGPLADELRAAAPANVRITSGLTDAQLRWVYAHATALIAPSIEDFGLTPLEAAAVGKPTLALHSGGYLDTILPGVSGDSFETASTRDIRGAVAANRRVPWDASKITAHARMFSEERFHSRLHDEVDALASR